MAGGPDPRKLGGSGTARLRGTVLSVSWSVSNLQLQAGSNLIYTSSLAPGIYFIRAAGNGAAQKFFLSR